MAVFAVAGLFPLPKSKIESDFYNKIAVLFPTYQENHVIIESVKDALNHNYNGIFEVFVIADGLQDETILCLNKMGAKVIVVSFDKSTKGKALKFAVNQIINDGFDIAMILDVDNIMATNCLNFINSAFNQGKKVIQTHRIAKNITSSFAFLDACNEEVNNRIFRKGQVQLGFSATLSGSGMAFDFSYLTTLLNNIGETVGEDKRLDFMLATDHVKAFYLDDVYVYDEKIENAKVFTNQRTRWIASQIEFMKKYAFRGFVMLFKGNIEFFNKTFQTFLVPRILLIGILMVMLAQSFFNAFGPQIIFWSILLIGLCLTLLVSVPLKLLTDKRLFAALLHIPRAMLGMLLALLNFNKGKNTFIVTPHQNKPTNKIKN